MRYAEKNTIQYHVGLSNEMLKGAEYVILINDRQFVEPIAKILDTNAIYLEEHREFLSFLSNVNGKNILVISTGHGAPAVGICVEELAMIGIKKFLRLGETWAVQKYLNVDDLILVHGSLRLDGASYHYAPENYPASTDLETTNKIEKILRKNKMIFYSGLIASVDTHYPNLIEKESIMKYTTNHFSKTLQDWRDVNILSTDFELGLLLVQCNQYNFQSAAVLDVVSSHDHANSNNNRHSAENRIENWRSFLREAIIETM